MADFGGVELQYDLEEDEEGRHCTIVVLKNFITLNSHTIILVIRKVSSNHGRSAIQNEIATSLI